MPGTDVVPLQVSGTIDTEMSTITAREMMAWGLSNLWEAGREGAYAVRHGDRPVNDFGRQSKGREATGDGTDPDMNFFERAYPCLFPYDGPCDTTTADSASMKLTHLCALAYCRGDRP